MIRTLDTSAWIEWFAASETGLRLQRFVPDQRDCVVPTIVQLELNKWLMRKADESRADDVMAHTMHCRIVELDTDIALYAAELSIRHKLATADAIIYATALLHDAELLTCDAHFDGLDFVRFVPKRSG